jgi:putative thioredoxin
MANINGKVQALSKFSGVPKENDIEGFVDNILKGYNQLTQGGQEEEEQVNLLETAKGLFSNAQFDEALEVYQSIISNENETKEKLTKAYTGIAMCMVSKGEIQNAIHFATMLKEKFPEQVKSDPEARVIVSMIEIYELAGEIPPIPEINKKLKENPKDLEARFQFAVYVFTNEPGMKSKEIGVHEALEILKMDPKWNEGKARKLLVKMFEVLGDCETTKKGRSRMASLMFR